MMQMAVVLTSATRAKTNCELIKRLIVSTERLSLFFIIMKQFLNVEVSTKRFEYQKSC